MGVDVALRELHEKRSRLISDWRGVLDKGDLGDEDRSEIDRMEADIDVLDKDIEQRSKFNRLADKSTDLSAAELSTEVVETIEEQRKIAASLNEYRTEMAGTPVQDTDEYRAAFYKLMTADDPRGELTTAEFRVLSKASAGAGLNLVPTEFQRTLIGLLRYTGAMRQLSNVFTTSSGAALQVPTVTAHGTASWVAENAAFSASDETFGQKTLNAYKNGTLIKVSVELLQDAAFDLEGYIGQEFAARIGVLENTAYVAGDGSAKPTGVTTSATAGVTAAGAAAITADELLDLIYSLSPPYRRNASFLMGDLTVKLIRKLKASGTGEYIWQDGLTRGEESSILGGAPSMLWGYPVYSDPDMPAATTGLVSVLFGDFSYYWIRDADGVHMQRLNELYAENGQVGFIAYHRTDGLLVNTAAVKKLTQA